MGGTHEAYTVGLGLRWSVDVCWQVNLGGGEGGDDDLHKKVASVFVTVHRSVVEMSETMLFEMKRHNYVTPTNYLELVTGYKRSVGCSDRCIYSVALTLSLLDLFKN